jgi:hypothetical protein
MQKGVFPETNIETGPIIRWNSRTRKHLFSNINHVKFDNLPIVEFIPKLGSDLEQNVYKTLLKSHEKIGWMWNGISINHFDVNEKVLNRIYFYNVAYNWLSIFRELPKDQDGVVSVSSSLKGLSCKDEVEASFAFVILSSRLAYWLWRVEGDGFHLNLSFLNRIPINISHFPPEIINKLVALSKELWITQLENPIESFNSGKKTINYSPEKSERIIDEIDKVIIRGLNLPESFIDYLKSFYLDNIIVGRQEEIQEKGQREKSNNG